MRTCRLPSDQRTKRALLSRVVLPSGCCTLRHRMAFASRTFSCPVVCRVQRGAASGAAQRLSREPGMSCVVVAASRRWQACDHSTRCENRGASLRLDKLKMNDALYNAPGPHTLQAPARACLARTASTAPPRCWTPAPPTKLGQACSIFGSVHPVMAGIEAQLH